MSINIEVDGTIYEGFTNISVTKSIDRVSGSFNFTLTQPDNITTFPIKNGSPCKIFVNNIKVIDGFIQRLSVSYNVNSHTINVVGGDKTVDLIDSYLKENIEFNANITLQKIIEDVVSSLGIDVKVIDNVGTLEKFKKSELVSGSPTNNAFEFVEKYCRKRQVLLSVNNDGNIILQRASTNLIPTKLLNEENGENNNILNADVSYDNTERFYQVNVKSQENFGAALPGITSVQGVDKLGTAFDTEIRQSRSLTLTAESSSDAFTTKERATWEVNIRRARGIVYSVTVQGFAYNEKNITSPLSSNLWMPNNLVHIVDNFADINAQMLIQNVTFNLDVNGGSTTTLDFITKDAYTLQAEQSQRSARTNNQGDSFNLGF